MAVNIDDKLAEMGLSLPSASAPAANYVPFVQVGSLLFVSGQIPADASGNLMTGKVGAEVDLAGGVAGEGLGADVPLARHLVGGEGLRAPRP